MIQHVHPGQIRPVVVQFVMVNVMDRITRGQCNFMPPRKNLSVRRLVSGLPNSVPVFETNRSDYMTAWVNVPAWVFQFTHCESYFRFGPNQRALFGTCKVLLTHKEIHFLSEITSDAIGRYSGWGFYPPPFRQKGNENAPSALFSPVRATSVT